MKYLYFYIKIKQKTSKTTYTISLETRNFKTATLLKGGAAGGDLTGPCLDLPTFDVELLIEDPFLFSEDILLLVVCLV